MSEKCEHKRRKFLGGHWIGKVAYLCMKGCGIFTVDYRSLTYPYPGMLEPDGIVEVGR